MAQILTAGLGFAQVEDIKEHLRRKTRSYSVFDLQTMDLSKIPAPKSSPRRDAIAAIESCLAIMLVLMKVR